MLTSETTHFLIVKPSFSLGLGLYIYQKTRINWSTVINYLHANSVYILQFHVKEC